MTLTRRHLIRIDGLAGLTAGLLVIALSEPLADLYQLPQWLLLVNGAANIAYGTFSTTLASLSRRPMSLITALVAANLLWAAVCAVAAAVLFAGASPLGGAHAALEMVFVGGLGLLEWRFRADLR